MMTKRKINIKFCLDNEITYATDDVNIFIKTLPDECIKLIVTSPPYNVGKEYEVKTSIETYLEQQEAIIKELIRVLADDGSICWQVGNYIANGEVFPLDIFYYNIFKKYGLKLRNRIIWHFEHGLHANNRLSGRYETILWFTKTDSYTFNLDDIRIPSKYPGKRHYKGEKKGQLSGNPLGKNPSDIWSFVESEWDKLIWDIPNVKANHPEKTEHPCQYPIELVERMVLALTNESDIILDPYAGVASTLLAGLLHNRKVVGIDYNEKYTKIGKARIEALLQGNLKYREVGKPIHQPSGKEKVARMPEEWKK